MWPKYFIATQNLTYCNDFKTILEIIAIGKISEINEKEIKH